MRIILRGLFCAGLLLLPLHAFGAGVVINEIAWMGSLPKSGETNSQASNNEWIELRNESEEDIIMDGWRLEWRDGKYGITFGSDKCANLRIPAGGYFLLERTDDETIPEITADCIYTGPLSNTGEYLILKNTEGNTIDQVNGSNGWQAGDNTTKETMQRIGNSWITAPTTPKRANDAAAQQPSPSPIPSPSPMPSPTPTPSPSPKPSPTPSLSSKPSPSLTPSPILTPAPLRSPVHSPSPAPSPAASPSSTAPLASGSNSNSSPFPLPRPSPGLQRASLSSSPSLTANPATSSGVVPNAGVTTAASTGNAARSSAAAANSGFAELGSAASSDTSSVSDYPSDVNVASHLSETASAAAPYTNASLFFIFIAVGVSAVAALGYVVLKKFSAS